MLELFEQSEYEGVHYLAQLGFGDHQDRKEEEVECLVARDHVQEKREEDFSEVAHAINDPVMEPEGRLWGAALFR